MNFWVQLIYIPYLSSGKSFSSSSEELLYGRAFQIEFNYSNWMFVWIHNGGYERKKKIRQTSVHDQTSDSHSAKRCDSRDYLYAIAEAEVSSNDNSRYRYQWGTHFCSTKLSLSWCFGHLFNNIEFWEGEWIKLISIFIFSLFIRGENEIKFTRVQFKNNIIFYFFLNRIFNSGLAPNVRAKDLFTNILILYNKKYDGWWFFLWTPLLAAFL